MSYAARVGGVVLLIAEVSQAQSRAPAAAPHLVVTRARGASLHLAREAAARLDAALASCATDAEHADPVAFASARAMTAVVRLRPDGHAVAVEVSPSQLPRGLSACAAQALLAWQQAGIFGPRAFVEVSYPLSHASSDR